MYIVTNAKLLLNNSSAKLLLVLSEFALLLLSCTLVIIR